MATAFRPKLGQNLQGIVAGSNPMFPQSMAPAGQMASMPVLQAALGTDTAPKPQGGGFFKEGGMGRYIAGAIGDALMHNAGMQPVFAPAMQQQRADQREEVQWTRRRQQQNDDWTQREDYKRNHPDPTAMERNLSTYQRFTPEQRATYGQMQTAERGDPFVTTTLPNGQFYAGPQSGLISALTGQASAPSAKPTITPDLWDSGQPAGGAGGNASGGFRR